MAALAALPRDAALGRPTSTCLTPVEPYREDLADYLAKIHKLIEPAVNPFLQMRVDPSFDADYSVALHSSPDVFSWAEAKQFFVTHYLADRNIGYSLSKYHDGKDEEVSVAVTTAELPRQLADRVHAAWIRMLLRTRYPDPDEFVLRADPTTIEFSCRRNTGALYAKAYEPVECKDSSLLIQLGFSLINYCHTPEDKRAAALKLIEKAAGAVEAYLKQHGRD
jgi:hypothetical protein